MYEHDALFAKLTLAERHLQRDRFLRPLMNEFFELAMTIRAREAGRTTLTQAAVYSLNQKEELLRVLEDARLPLDNTRSERALRQTVIGRKNYLFHGSDKHAQSTAAIYSVIASCRLHGIDSFTYIRDVLRLLPYWPRERMIELAPKNWNQTRARLNQDQLARHIGKIDVPPPAIIVVDTS